MTRKRNCTHRLHTILKQGDEINHKPSLGVCVGFQRWIKRLSTIDPINSELFFERNAPRLKSHEKAHFNIAPDLSVLCWDSWPRNHRSVFEPSCFFSISRPLIFSHSPLTVVFQHCDFGCIEVQTSDYVANDVCEKLYIKIKPDADNLYRLTIFSGYPLGKADQRKTWPTYMQDYVWGEDNFRVSLDAKNCLRVARR